MEYYDWEKNASKKNIEILFGEKCENIENIGIYSSAVTSYMNDGKDINTSFNKMIFFFEKCYISFSKNTLLFRLNLS